MPELNINKEDSLKDRINEIISYLNQNINSKFQNLDIKNEKENESNDTNIDYHLKTSINFEAKGFFEYNKSLFVLYNDDIIKFFNKENFENKITIKESILKDIKICQKNEENKIIVFIPKKYFLFKLLIIIMNIEF